MDGPFIWEVRLIGAERDWKSPEFHCRRLVHNVLAVALVAGCASLKVTDTTPLPAAKLEAPGSETISSDGYRFEALAAANGFPDLFVGVAMSGGGKRSAAFAYGALKGMSQLTISARDGKRSLLQAIDEISGVSGGSFTAAYYGLYHEKAFGQYEKDFLYADTTSRIYGIYLLPWHWGWLVNPSTGTNNYVERVYDETMFHGATFKDLMRQGLPLVAIGATGYQLWQCDQLHAGNSSTSSVRTSQSSRLRARSRRRTGFQACFRR